MYDKLLAVITRNGALQPAHLRGWAIVWEQDRKYHGVNVVARYSESDCAAWLREVADYIEVDESRVKEEANAHSKM